MKPPTGLALSTVSCVGPMFLRLMARSWSVTMVNRAPFDRHVLGGGGAVAVLWHEMIMPGAAIFRDLGVFLMISRSKDGDVSAAVNTRLGFRWVRGSSSRGGGIALERLIRQMGRSGVCALTVDGPRGPAHRAKAGCVTMAKKTGSPLLPVGCAVWPKIRLPNWDRTLVPLPLAHVTMAFGDPIPVPADADRGTEDRIRLQVEEAITAANARAARAAGL
jgi:lysophospholipid acyltransferase (LPLAT)-like uncharacterized protein